MAKFTLHTFTPRKGQSDTVTHEVMTAEQLRRRLAAMYGKGATL